MPNVKSDGTIDTTGLKQERIPGVMSGEGHDVSFDFDGLPDELYVNDTVALVMFASCPSGCDLREDVITISDSAGEVVAQGLFTEQEEGLACTEGLLMTMPPKPGDYQYIIHYEPHELPMPDDGGPAFPNPHPARDLLLVLTVKAHHVALSNWGLTAPVWVNEPLEVCIGASCSDGCELTGCKVEVYDADGALVGSGELQPPEEPRPTLWWTKISAVAPGEAKLQRWEARFVQNEDLEIPHETAAHKFSFVGRVRPERNFEATVIDEKTGKPQRSARIEIKPEEGKAQFASTNAEGKASIGCTKGVYSLKVTAPSKKTFTETVNLTEHDLEVEVHLQPTSTSDPVIPMKVISPLPEAVAEQAAETVEQVAEVVEEVQQAVEDAAQSAADEAASAVEAAQEAADQVVEQVQDVVDEAVEDAAKE